MFFCRLGSGYPYRRGREMNRILPLVKIALYSLILIFLLPWVSRAGVCLNCGANPVTATQFQTYSLPLIVTGGSLAGRPVEFFVWKADTAGNKSYLNRDGAWRAFSSFAELSPFRELSSMVEGATLDWSAFPDTSETGSFTLYLCCDGNVDGQLPEGQNTSTAVCGEVAVTIDPKYSMVVDDGSSETSYTGSWKISGAGGHFGEDSLWSRDGSTYSWSFTPAESGTYEVFMWWTDWPSRSTSAPVEISYKTGKKRVYVNQRQDGGKWNSLGQYEFAAGSKYNVTITSNPAPSSTCADAVRFVFKE